MLKVTWRNLVERKVRLALSAFAIVLGVAFVAGSFIFTDAMGNAFDGIIEGSTADVEVAYRGANNFDSQQDTRVIPASVVDRLRALPEVGSVHPSVSLQSVYVIGSNGKVVGGNGAPGLAFNNTGTPAADRCADHHPHRGRRSRAGPARSLWTWTPPARPGYASGTGSGWSPPGPADGHRVTMVGIVGSAIR